MTDRSKSVPIKYRPNFSPGRLSAEIFRPILYRYTFPSIGHLAETGFFGQKSNFRPICCYIGQCFWKNHSVPPTFEFKNALFLTCFDEKSFFLPKLSVSVMYRFWPNIGSFVSAEYRYRPKQEKSCFGRTLVSWIPAYIWTILPAQRNGDRCERGTAAAGKGLTWPYINPVVNYVYHESL